MAEHIRVPQLRIQSLDDAELNGREPIEREELR